MAKPKDTDRPPAFLFYVDDFTSDGVVEAMTTEEVGAYCLLLCKAWKENAPGTIPADDEVLARWTRLTQKRWSVCRERVLKAFTLESDGRLHQKRMKLEFSKYLKDKKKRSKSASTAANARWMRDACDPHLNRNAANMRFDASQVKSSQVKESPNSNGQSKVNPSTDGFDFDQHAVDGGEWLREFAEYSRLIAPTDEDRALLAKLAWLACAGAPVVSHIRDGLDGITVLRHDGKGPDRPVAYLRTCLRESIGSERFEAWIKRAPSRTKCAEVMEGSE